ncbi:MAG: sulfite exporter TauE/SafE family protein [Blastocatellia bacterium]
MGTGAAFFLGLLGSLHCVGMCGPLALALTPRGATGRRMHTGRLLYHLGRTLTYALLGAVMGLAGGLAGMRGWQQGFSVTAGLLILLWLVLPRAYKERVTRRNTRLFGKLQQPMRDLLRAPGYSAQLLTGVLNGLLPCGFVTLALAGAMTQPGAIRGALFMSLFGLGTVPAMLLLTVAPGWMPSRWRLSLGRLLPAGALLVAILLIIRGFPMHMPATPPASAAQSSAPALFSAGVCQHH